MPTDELRGVLALNLALQAIYLPVGLVLATRAKPVLRGFGWGVLSQAAALGAIDAFFYARCAAL